MKKPYTNTEIISLSQRIMLCHYASLALGGVLEDSKNKPIVEINYDPLDGTKLIFYEDAILIHFGALISFFHKNDDQVILSKLNSTAEQLKNIHELRSVSAHVLDIPEIERLHETYIQKASPVALKEDYKTLKKYITELLDNWDLREANDFREDLRRLEDRFNAERVASGKEKIDV